MATRRDCLKLVAGGAGMTTLGGCTWLFTKQTVRYRITVIVDTPKGPASGSAVWQVKFIEAPAGLPWTETKGDAFPIDLPDGQTIFALIAGDRPNPYNLIDRIIIDRIKDIGPSWWQKDYDEIAERWKVWPDSWAIPLDDTHDHPSLARFRDVRNPGTMEFLDRRDLSAVMGPGISLRGMNVEITRDPVSTGIEKRLPWLDNGKWQNFDIGNIPQARLLPGFTPTFKRELL